MAVTIGASGLVSSWAGTDNTAIVTGLGEHTANLTMTSGPLDRTQYGASLAAMSAGATLRSWSGTISGRLMTSSVPQVGNLGSVAISNAADTYVTNVRAWRGTFQAIELDSTVYGSPASIGWRSFRAGLVKFSGTYEALVDDTTDLELTYAPDTTLRTLTLTLNTGNTLAFEAVVHDLGLTIPVGDLNVVTYGFESNGNITAAGTGSVFTAGTLAIPAAGSLIFQAATGQTYTGDAFPTSISIDHAPNKYIDIDVAFRGTGALTIG